MIRVAGPGDVPQVRTVVARALADDPMIRWIVPPEATDRMSRVAVFFSAQVERLVLLGHTDVATVDDRVVGAALWIPPGAGRLDGLPLAAELAGIVSTPERVQAFADQFHAARDGAPVCDGPYLATLGVLDSCRGQGIGRRLLQAGHGHFGQVTTWLESTNPDNLSLYERAGYLPTHRAPFADGSTVMTRLVRSSPQVPPPDEPPAHVHSPTSGS